MAKYILVHGIRVAKDFTPEIFGRLTTLGPAFLIGNKRFCVCRCECGTTHVFREDKLISSHTKSCGCLTKSHGFLVNKKRTVEYTAWARMSQRCTNPNNPRYKDYGGRGIKVCDRWRTFEGFFADMGKKPSPQHSIDRIDNDGDYCPENCRWATIKQQANNKRSNRIVSAFGKQQTLAEWADEMGLSWDALWSRLKRKWPLEKALLHPMRVDECQRPQQ